MSRLEKAALISELITGILWIIYILIQISIWLPSSSAWQIMIPFEVNFSILFTLIIVSIGIVVYHFWQIHSIEYVERVRAYIFFPKGTPEENKTLDYHQKHYHKKLIVNFKTEIPQAYLLPATNTCYGWRLIHKYDLWTSEEDSIYPDPDIQKWCKEKGFHPNPWSASKEELLKTDSFLKQTEHENLIEVYSQLHAMIIRVNTEIPREDALRLTVGSPVKASLIDVSSLSAVFNRHIHELRDKDLKMWIEIEKQIKERGFFWVSRDLQIWFDELETEYNRLK